MDLTMFTVAGAAAEVAGDGPADVVLGRLGFFLRNATLVISMPGVQ